MGGWQKGLKEGVVLRNAVKEGSPRQGYLVDRVGVVKFSDTKIPAKNATNEAGVVNHSNLFYF